MIWYYSSLLGLTAYAVFFFLPEMKIQEKILSVNGMIFYFAKIFPLLLLFLSCFSFERAWTDLTQVTTLSVYSNELQLIFDIKRTITTVLPYVTSYMNKAEVLLKWKFFCNALYVKSLDYFLKNTKPQNIKTPMLYGHSQALSRPMLPLSNCSTVTFILNLSQSEKPKQFLWLMMG